MLTRLLFLAGLVVSSFAHADLVDTCVRNAQINGMGYENARTLCRGKQPGERPLDCSLTSTHAGLGMSEEQIARLCNRAPSMKPLWCAQTALNAGASRDAAAELCHRANDHSPAHCFRQKILQGHSEEEAVYRCVVN